MQTNSIASKLNLDALSSKQDSISNAIQLRLDKIDSTDQIIAVNQEQISNALETVNTLLNSGNEMKLLWVGAIIGAVLGFILSQIATFAVRQIKYYHFNSIYSGYSGVYLAVKKYDGENKKVYRCFELKQRRNVFTVENGISVLGNEDYDSVITMDENNEKHGRGHFQHKVGTDGTIGFGFLEVQLASGVILAHETIYNREGGQNSDAFRWIKQDPSRRDEIFKQYREIQISEKTRKFGELKREQ
jgi:hypothetical protein